MFEQVKSCASAINPNPSSVNSPGMMKSLHSKFPGNFADLCQTFPDILRSLCCCFSFPGHNLLADYGFYRVHNSFLVNLSEVTRYVKGEGGYLVMNNGDNVGLTGRRKEAFIRLFGSV